MRKAGGRTEASLWRRGSEGGLAHEHRTINCPIHFPQSEKEHACKLGLNGCQAGLMKTETSLSGRPLSLEVRSPAQPEEKEGRAQRNRESRRQCQPRLQRERPTWQHPPTHSEELPDILVEGFK